MKLVVLGYLYEKSGPFANGQRAWRLVKFGPDTAETPKDSDWWPGESSDRQAWIYTKVEIPDDASPDDLNEIIHGLSDIADLKFAELYPGRVVG